MSKRIFFTVLAALSFLFCFASDTRPKPRVLVMSKTAGFYHTAIPVGIAAIQNLGKKHGFDVDTTKNSALFTAGNLKKYAAVVFLNTTGTILDSNQKQAFENYIRSGGGFVGVHAATDTEYSWPWYNKLVGAWFLNHPQQQVARLKVLEKNHPSTRHLPDVWERKDEWYNFKNINPDVKTLITIDEKSYKGGKNGSFHPMAWYHDFEGGRAFYTALGHTEESYEEPMFLEHLLGGIRYAMGRKK